GQAHQTAARDLSSVPGQKPSMRRWNIGRDTAGAVLLLLALALPWNLYFGMGIPDSSKVVGLLLILVTVFSLVSVAVTYVGPARLLGSRANPVLAGRVRLSLNAAYLLLVLAFVVFDEVQTLRYGGTIKVSGGVGPGAWLGVAGSLLCAQPGITQPATADGELPRWLAGARVIGYASIVGAVLSFVFVLYWRVRYALPSSAGTSGFGKQNIAVIVTAVVYGVVALAAVVLASNWIIQGAKPSRLVTVALGAATLVAGLVVWFLPIGREIDGFHGIAQNTSTAGVGFEGYLAWAAAAAVLGPRTLGGALTTGSTEHSLWREAARKGLLLIVVWCAGSMLMRITDLLVAVSLNFPFSRYDSMALAAFDLLTALVAVWLRANLANVSLPVRLVWSACGMLATLTIARIVMGIVLAPRFLSPKRPVGINSAVYGNNLAQQITSTFDVVLCGLALAILTVAIVTSQRRHRTAQPPRQARPQAHLPALPTQPPRIRRTTQDPTHRSSSARPKIYRTP
ncbi:MAG: hypothetical protein J2P17_14155, partial [Mycobacterium sp.]|nr:hypothetical protein [Mycobacterium sp.]